MNRVIYIQIQLHFLVINRGACQIDRFKDFLHFLQLLKVLENNTPPASGYFKTRVASTSHTWIFNF